MIKELREATKPEMVEVAPGRWVPRERPEPPDVSLCRWREQAGGTYEPVPLTERLVRLDTKLAARLGFSGRQYNTLRRLGAAGFFELIRVAPGVTLINLDSYFGHLRRCAEDPEFWDTDGANMREYRRALGA